MKNKYIIHSFALILGLILSVCHFALIFKQFNNLPYDSIKRFIFPLDTVLIISSTYYWVSVFGFKQFKMESELSKFELGWKFRKYASTFGLIACLIFTHAFNLQSSQNFAFLFSGSNSELFNVMHQRRGVVENRKLLFGGAGKVNFHLQPSPCKTSLSPTG